MTFANVGRRKDERVGQIRVIDGDYCSLVGSILFTKVHFQRPKEQEEKEQEDVRVDGRIGGWIWKRRSPSRWDYGRDQGVGSPSFQCDLVTTSGGTQDGLRLW